MIIGPALASWLADPAAQQRSYEGVEASALKWSRHPFMAGLERQIAEMPVRTPEAVLEAARRFIGNIAEIEGLVGDLIRTARSDPFFRPPFHTDSNELNAALLLFSNAELAIALGIINLDELALRKTSKRGATSLGFTGRLSVFKYLKAGNATISFWEAPRLGDDFSAATAGRARFVDRRRIEDGEEIVIDGRYQTFVLEHAQSDVLYFQAVVQTAAAPIAAEFDSKSLSFVGASSTDEASSRIQILASLLRAMDRDDAVPIMAEALNSPFFYARWHIMREMLALDAVAAVPALQRMAEEDAHPDVRASARQTLELFFGPDAAGMEQGERPCHA